VIEISTNRLYVHNLSWRVSWWGRYKFEEERMLQSEANCAKYIFVSN
jgi:hypothetical protein